MYDSTDPTRIPRVTAALQRAWEGQPDLTLGALMGVLTNRGIGWGSTDAEIVEELTRMEAEHPSLLDATPAHPYLISTTAPGRLVTVTDGLVVVRDSERARAMPALWRYDSLRRTGPGRPLVVRDAEGIEHRIGVVRLITRLDADAAPSLRGLARGDIGGHMWLVALEGGARVAVGRRIRVWEPGRRDVGYSAFSWQRVLEAREGEELVVAPAGGGAPVTLGRVERCVLMEAGS